MSVTIRPEVRDAMIEFVAPRYGVTLADVMGKSRIRPIAYARQEVMWRLRNIKGPDGQPRHSFPAIARALGMMDHTSIVHGVLAYEKRLAELTDSTSEAA
jgi:chromosomal replication initiation ATPase DnaA